MAESYLTKLANEVLEGAEQLSNRLEEGISVLLRGGDLSPPPEEAASPQESSSGSGAEQTTFDNNPFDGDHPDEWDDDDAAFEEAFAGRSPLEDITQGVLSNIMSGQRAPHGLLEHMNAFRHAITWSEPFILGLIAFQIIMLVATIAVSRKQASLTARLTVMLLIGVVVRMAERLNTWGAQRWKWCCTQNYFDQQGIFISMLLSTPLMLDCLVMLLCFLREASQLLVQVKSTQIKRQQQRQQQQQAQQKDATGDIGGARRSAKAKEKAKKGETKKSK